MRAPAVLLSAGPDGSSRRAHCLPVPLPVQAQQPVVTLPGAPGHGFVHDQPLQGSGGREFSERCGSRRAAPDEVADQLSGIRCITLETPPPLELGEVAVGTESTQARVEQPGGAVESSDMVLWEVRGEEVACEGEGLVDLCRGERARVRDVGREHPTSTRGRGPVVCRGAVAVEVELQSAQPVQRARPCMEQPAGEVEPELAMDLTVRPQRLAQVGQCAP